MSNATKNNVVISIGTKFSGTDATGDQEHNSSKIPYADEPSNCIEQYNEAVDALRETETETGIDAADIDRIFAPGAEPSDELMTTSYDTERVSETESALVLGDDVGGDDPRIQQEIDRQKAEEAAKIAAAGTPEAALQDTFNYNRTAQYTKGYQVKGARVDKALFGDKILTIESVDHYPALQESKITWSVGVFNNKGKLIKESKRHTVVHTNKGA